ncbi:hypothetical protein ALC57_11573 [Trachymyrmex cornetzi]|uniref:Cyclic nucleotide-binding domain-containing protein n=1 Tax=Trachymyrmex cornetzi TaxID=471704 RepID=A0A151J2F8_9HYME|nr:hypothetical protein ALC57_11573 [Trachymyrmex cornetzi]
MYIVNKNQLRVVADNRKAMLATLKAGSYFREISILNMGTMITFSRFTFLILCERASRRADINRFKNDLSIAIFHYLSFSRTYSTCRFSPF